MDPTQDPLGVDKLDESFKIAFSFSFNLFDNACAQFILRRLRRIIQSFPPEEPPLPVKVAWEVKVSEVEPWMGIAALRSPDAEKVIVEGPTAAM